MILPGISRKSRVAIYDSNKFKDEQDPVAYCQRCLEMANNLSRLTNTIYSKNLNGDLIVTPASDTQLQCHECGTIYPSYEVKQEGKLTYVVQLLDSPADFGKVVIKSVYESSLFV